jgi:hypothetical protein
MMAGLPPVWFAQTSYYQRLFSHSLPIVALGHRFKKQQGLNRMKVAMADGPHVLSIPLVSSSLGGSIDQVAISFKENWSIQHWRTIEAAYQKAPYFPFYAPDLWPLFQNPSEYYLDQSRRHMDLILRWMRMSKDGVQYVNVDSAGEEFLLAAHPFYHQVFSDTRSFTPFMSILDLFFNVGPESALFIFSE